MTTKEALTILDGMGPSFILISHMIKDADEALNAAGCPFGNEQGEYSLAGRITWMGRSKEYAWRQLDEMRKRYLPVPTVIAKAQSELPGWPPDRNVGTVWRNKAGQTFVWNVELQQWE